MPGAIAPEGAAVRIFTAFRNIVSWVLLGCQKLLCPLDLTFHQGRFQLHPMGHIHDLEQLGNIQFLTTDIVRVDAHKVRAGDGNTAMLQYILLVGNIDAVNLRFVSCAFYFVNGIAAIFCTENIHSAVVALIGERGFADDRVIF